MNPDAHANERRAEQAFSNQSGIFDALYARSTLIHYKRQRVRAHALSYFKPGGHILELNCGTGEDALFFAGNGYKVHATDISEGMLREMERKVHLNRLEGAITYERCSYTQLHLLANKGPYDHIFSNFAGLNCTGELDGVLRSFSGLLKPGGTVTLVMLPGFCLWETLLLFRGKFKTAFRRFGSGRGRVAHVEGMYFNCWYYNPSFIKNRLKAEFEILCTEGLCTVVPPSYIEGFAERHPKTYRWLAWLEEKLKYSWPWRCIGDYYILSLRKRTASP